MSTTRIAEIATALREAADRLDALARDYTPPVPLWVRVGVQSRACQPRSADTVDAVATALIGKAGATIPEHYRKAEELLAALVNVVRGTGDDASLVAEAQVHATLALAAATALGRSTEYMDPPDYDAWQKAAATAAPSASSGGAS